MVKIAIKDLNIWFGQVHALKGLNLEVYNNEILSIIGPANSGKTTFLRMINRLNEIEKGFRMKGSVYFDNEDINTLDVQLVRQKIGMVFAMPLPLPLSIFDNVVYGPRMHGVKNKKALKDIAFKSLEEAYLWDEVKDRLDVSAFKLSGGQQQRLCIARTLAVNPDVILFDEPCSGLDPISTAKIEDSMEILKKSYTLVLVTNNVKQAARVGDRTAFFLDGQLIEVDNTKKIFTAPSQKSTEDYISGKFG